MTSRQFQKSSVGSILVLVIPLQSDSEKMCKSERLMKLRNGYRLKRSHFTPHLSDVTLSGPRARPILFGGSNTTHASSVVDTGEFSTVVTNFIIFHCIEDG